MYLFICDLLVQIAAPVITEAQVFVPEFGGTTSAAYCIEPLSVVRKVDDYRNDPDKARRERPLYPAVISSPKGR